MLKYFLALIMMATPVFSQEYKVFNPEVKKTDGEYLVLVTAQWCSPCAVLKNKLKAFPKRTIYEIDYDSNRETALVVLKGNVNLPTFVKYRVKQGVVVEQYFNTSANQDLGSFLVVEIEKDLPKDSPKELEKVSPEVEKVDESLVLNDRIIGPLNKLSEKLDLRFNENQRKFEEILGALKSRQDNEPVLFLLRGVRDSIRNFDTALNKFQGFIDRAETENAKTRGLISNLADRIDARIESLSGENQRVFGQLKELVESNKEFRREGRETFSVLKGFVERWRKSEEDITEIRESQRRFEPGLRILERLDNFIGKLTESMLYLVGSIMLVLIAGVFALALASAIASGLLNMFKKVIRKFKVFEWLT